MNAGAIRKWRIARWYLGYAANQVNWQGNVTVALLVLWVALVCTIDLPLQSETQRIAIQLGKIGAGESGRFSRESPLRRPQDPTLEFIDSLPSNTRYLEQLLALNQLADKCDVIITSVHYRYEQVSGLPITRVAMAMEVRGDEKPQHAFLQRTLNAFPNLAISRLAYTRDTDGASTYKQKLDVDLYFQAHPKAAK
ncbi:hypothetical protein V4C53_44980 [Paraburkholderia azotifigens]|uniref:hypothetical protein n=1 Tax=Paraburkholderia azotifigens TaxID=2057004 RepID=UPI00317E6E1B